MSAGHHLAARRIVKDDAVLRLDEVANHPHAQARNAYIDLGGVLGSVLGGGGQGGGQQQGCGEGAYEHGCSGGWMANVAPAA